MNLEKCHPANGLVTKLEAEKKSSGDLFSKRLPATLFYLATSYLDMISLWNLPRVNRSFRQLTATDSLASTARHLRGNSLWPAIFRSTPQEMDSKLLCSSGANHGTSTAKLQKICDAYFFIQEGLERIYQDSACTRFRIIPRQKGTTGAMKDQDCGTDHTNGRKILAITGNQVFASRKLGGCEIYDLQTGEVTHRFYPHEISEDDTQEPPEGHQNIDACFPIDSQHFVTVAQGGLIQQWEITAENLSLTKSVQIDRFSEIWPDKTRIGNVLYLINGHHLEAYSLKDLSPIAIPEIRGGNCLTNGSQLFLHQHDGRLDDMLSAYNTTKEGVIEDSPLWVTGPFRERLTYRGFSDRWVYLELYPRYAQRDTEPYGGTCIDARTGKRVMEYEHYRPVYSYGTTTYQGWLKGDLFFREKGNPYCLSCTYLPANKTLPVIDLSEISKIYDLEVAVENGISVLYVLAKKSWSEPLQLLRYTLQHPSEKGCDPLFQAIQKNESSKS